MELLRSLAFFLAAGLCESGVFVLLSILWGWWVGGTAPDRFDLIGARAAGRGGDDVLAEIG